MSLWNPQHGTCPTTGKRVYRKRHDAEIDARRIHGSQYKCPHCGKYHLTHYPKRVCKAVGMLIGSNA